MDCPTYTFGGCSCTTHCLSPDRDIQNRLGNLQAREDARRSSQFDRAARAGVRFTVILIVGIGAGYVAYAAMASADDAFKVQDLIAQESTHHG